MPNERTYSFLEAKQKIEAYCAYQERCSFEIENKLKLWGVDHEDRGRLLAFLIEHNFLNEERFAESFVSGKVNIKRWGRIKIKQQLKAKFISEYSTRKALESIDPELYYNNLVHLAEFKSNQLKGEKNSFKKRVKLLMFLAGKGYEMDLINDVVNELLND